MSDTPRTDKCPTPKHGYVPVEFARQLEREVNRLRKFASELTVAKVGFALKSEAERVLQS